METYENGRHDSSNQLPRTLSRRGQGRPPNAASVQARCTSMDGSHLFTAVSAMSVVMRVIQRWSVGHRRRKQGLQYGFSWTIVHRGVTGAVPFGSVGPKIATVGSPTAAATCMAPESFPMKRWHFDSSAGRSAMVVFPVRSMGDPRIWAAMAADTLASAAVPKRMTSVSF